MLVRVEPCDHATARRAVERWHYSRCMPTSAKLTYAAFEGDRFVGVLIFGVGVGRGTFLPGVDQRHALELQRVALRDHQAPVSQFLAAAVRRIKRHHRVRLLMSYADPYHGHHGGIYQAAGWTYVGASKPGHAWRAPDGTLKHNRVVAATGYNRQYGSIKRAWKQAVFERVALPGKHLYLLGLDRPTRRSVAKLARPYPPRVPSVDGDTSTSPVEEAGSTPAARSADPPTRQPPARRAGGCAFSED